VNTLLIAGIDPGTNFAYALLDLKGNLIDIRSYKNTNTNILIKDMQKNGRIIIIASDVTPMPSQVKKIARQLQTHTIEPDDNLRYMQKIHIVDTFLKKQSEYFIIANKHEKAEDRKWRINEQFARNVEYALAQRAGQLFDEYPDELRYLDEVTDSIHIRRGLILSDKFALTEEGRLITYAPPVDQSDAQLARLPVDEITKNPKYFLGALHHKAGVHYMRKQQCRWVEINTFLDFYSESFRQSHGVVALPVHEDLANCCLVITPKDTLNVDINFLQREPLVVGMGIYSDLFYPLSDIPFDTIKKVVDREKLRQEREEPGSVLLDFIRNGYQD